MNFTLHNLKKIEDIFNGLGYKIRYEKGTFQGGYCIVNDSKMVVVNKFLDTENRINVLLEIAENNEIYDKLEDTKAQKFLQTVLLLG